MPSPSKLRDFIHDIRSAKTAAEERSVVNRECALIRDILREEDGTCRCRNVAKLLYIHMLGYPAHFAQLDCLKLIASSKFTDKRIGYLGAMLLLDEKTDVHMLVTNSLKNDLSHRNPYIVSLALSTVGSICSTEMSRDLVVEVERLISSSNVYIRKKAILCAFRMCRRVPDLIELFLPLTETLLEDRNHAVMVASVTLITEMCCGSLDTLDYFRQVVPDLVRITKNLISADYSPEHEVSGIGDPFLQVKILKLFRILGHGDREASDAMNDVLTQVATNTDTSKNVGHSILYEIVQTIMGVESESGLRVLAVNILGKFLLKPDKNIRYVALCTLQRVVSADLKAVQRHRDTIVECLQDPDVSIQRQAMELCFVLINESNIRSMMRKMISFLCACEPEFKADCCSSLVRNTEKYASNKRWYLDTMLQLLVAAGRHARGDILTSLVTMVSSSPNVQPYAVMRIYSALATQDKQAILIQVAAWIIGEYGEYLLLPHPYSMDEDCETNDDDNITSNNPNIVTEGTPIIIPSCTTPVPEDDILLVLETCLLATSIGDTTKQVLQMSLMKLSTRVQEESSIWKIKQLLAVHATSVHVELQQRSVEFSSILTNHDGIRPGLLETMPALESRVLGDTNPWNTSPSADAECGEVTPKTNHLDITHYHNGSKENPNDIGGYLLDLISLEDTPANHVSLAIETSSHCFSKQSGSDLAQLLDDVAPIVCGTCVPTITTDQSPLQPMLSPHSGTSSMSPSNGTGSAPSVTVYEGTDGINLRFSFERRSNTETSITLHATNHGSQLIDQFSFQAAVPKSFQLQLCAPSSDTLIPRGGLLTQMMKITNINQQIWRMKIKLQYRINGETKSVQQQLNSFPECLWT